MKLILSCEHATAAIPEDYAGLFAGVPDLLQSHRGYDIGALEICRHLEGLAEAVFYGGCSRLLIDLNRSLRHRGLFSEFSRPLARQEKVGIIGHWYAPFRDAALLAAEKALVSGDPLLHLSVHSFTPVLNGIVRPNDVGILYDPQRSREKALARRLTEELHRQWPQLKIRMNHPYRGTSDGHVTELRRRFEGDSYLGIELEINQRLLGDACGREQIGKAVSASLAGIVVD